MEYQLSDYYIQLTEACQDVTTVRKLSVEMHNAFVKRVQLIKHASDGPSVISAVKDYIEGFLVGGCSADPITLLKNAGVDMSTTKPVTDALALFGDLIKQMDELGK